jgi:hypothetical protein
MKTLITTPGRLTATGLQFDSEKPSIESLRQTALLLADLGKSLVWAIGDLLAKVDRLYPDELDTFCEMFDLERRTLIDYKSLAVAFPPADRNDLLPAKTHRLVRAMPRAAQVEHLKIAVDRAESYQETRDRIKQPDPAKLRCDKCGAPLRPAQE